MQDVKHIDADKVETLVKNRDAILIDVREPEEYLQGYIEGAIFMPLSQCHPAHAPRNPDKKIIFYCKAGGRSQQACEALEASGAVCDFYNYAGGFDEWKDQDRQIAYP